MQRHTGPMRSSILAACLLVRLFPPPLLSAGEQVGLRLSASVWKRSVVLEEPILVRVELRNTTPEPISVVPPYVNVWGRPEAPWPLSFTIADEPGQRLPNGWKYAKTGFEPVAYGLPWWGPYSGLASAPPRREPWHIPAHSAPYMWINLLQFYPLKDPGRYHLTFEKRGRKTGTEVVSKPVG